MIKNYLLCISREKTIVSYLEIYDWLVFLNWFYTKKKRHDYFYVPDLVWWFDESYDDPSEDVFLVKVKYDKILNRCSQKNTLHDAGYL